MNSIKKTFFICLTVIAASFTSCEDASNDISTELTIQNKVEILKSGEWLLKGFEDSVMHTYKDGKQFTYYGTDSVFSDEAIPGTQAYVIDGEQITFDYNFGNMATYEVKISCDNNIIEFYSNGELNKTLYKRDSDYKNCL
tara:strand:+ start:17537 stop:17956 length:420 start_codon:yes stop_codon:yes gene_type:complete